MTLTSVPVSEKLALNVNEAASLLDLSRTQVYRLVKSGELRSKRCGARVLIPRRALDDYLADDGNLKASS